MVAGVSILFATDGLLALAGVWLMRSRRFGDSLPLSVVALATISAFIAHIAGYAACQAAVGWSGEADADVSARMALFLCNAVSGAVPAMVYGYAFVIATANSVSMQFSMLDKKPEPLSSDAFKPARAFANRGDFVRAFEECRRLAEQFPESPLPLLETAALQDKAARYVDAAETLRRALRLFGHLREVRQRASFMLAELLEHRLGDPETAAYLRERLRTDASNGHAAARSARTPAHWVEMERARRLGERGDVDRAVAHFREAFRRDPAKPRPMLEAATLLERTERYAESADVLRELARTSVAGSEAWAEAMYRVARLLEAHLADPEGGRYVLREVMRQAPASKGAALARQWLRDSS